MICFLAKTVPLEQIPYVVRSPCTRVARHIVALSNSSPFRAGLPDYPLQHARERRNALSCVISIPTNDTDVTLFQAT
jgi:hypothetical protein